MKPCWTTYRLSCMESILANMLWILRSRGFWSPLVKRYSTANWQQVPRLMLGLQTLAESRTQNLRNSSGRTA